MRPALIMRLSSKRLIIYGVLSLLKISVMGAVIAKIDALLREGQPLLSILTVRYDYSRVPIEQKLACGNWISVKIQAMIIFNNAFLRKSIHS